MSIVPVLPATELTAGSALYAMYNICYKVRSFPLKRCKMTGRADRAKMLTTNNLKPSVWDTSLDGTRIALIKFVNPATPAVETGAGAGDNQTLSLAPLPDAVTITDVLQVNSSAGTLTASDFQIVLLRDLLTQTHDHPRRPDILVLMQLKQACAGNGQFQRCERLADSNYFAEFYSHSLGAQSSRQGQRGRPSGLWVCCNWRRC